MAATSQSVRYKLHRKFIGICIVKITSYQSPCSILVAKLLSVMSHDALVVGLSLENPESSHLYVLVFAT